MDTAVQFIEQQKVAAQVGDGGGGRYSILCCCCPGGLVTEISCLIKQEKLAAQVGGVNGGHYDVRKSSAVIFCKLSAVSPYFRDQSPVLCATNAVYYQPLPIGMQRLQVGVFQK